MYKDSDNIDKVVDVTADWNNFVIINIKMLYALLTKNPIVPPTNLLKQYIVITY